MKFCRNCGKELASEVKFCKDCGHSVTKPSHQEENSVGDKNTNTDDHAKTQPKQASKQPVQLSKKSKLWISIIGALIVLLFIGHKIGESVTSYEKKLEKFEEAMIEQNAKKVASLLEADTKNLTINKDTVQGFIDYYTENPSEMNGLFAHLKEQGLAYKNNPNYIEDHSYYAVNLVKDGKTFIYDNYQIKVSPVYFTVYTNYQDTEITMNGETIDTATDNDFTKEYGPYLPGEYTFGGVYESDFIDLETERTYSNISPEYAEEISLHIDGEDVYFEVPGQSGLKSIKLFINDQDTDIDLLKQDTIGPVLTDGSMEVSYEAEFPWGKMKTDKQPINDYYMNVAFSADDAVKEAVQEVLIKYNQEYLATKTTADAKKMTVAGKDKIDDIVSDAEYRKKYDDFYKGKFIGMDIDNESFGLYYASDIDKWSIRVDTITIFEEDQYYNANRKPELETSENEIEYTLVYDEKDDQWLVSATGYGYVEGDDLIEHREKDPKTYTSEWESLD